MNLENNLSVNKNKKSSDDFIKLSRIIVNEDYCKKWNETSKDFVCITKGGELLNQTLYRLGGSNTRLKLDSPIKDKYILILKYVESFYPSNISKKREAFLKGVWCILDNQGNEKVEFESFKSPYLIKDSCIYSLERKYYNIETGELYCRADGVVESGEFLFLQNSYDDNKSKRGVIKVNKKNGSWELFSE